MICFHNRGQGGPQSLFVPYNVDMTSPLRSIEHPYMSNTCLFIKESAYGQKWLIHTTSQAWIWGFEETWESGVQVSL